MLSPHLPVIPLIADMAYRKGVMIATAESCTGGMLAERLTSFKGASRWFLGGVVVYSNSLKSHYLGVSSTLLDTYGAVSEEVVAAMSEGLLSIGATLTISISGIAGPESESISKPVGMVCFGLSCANKETQTQTQYFKGDRIEIREEATLYALNMLLMSLNQQS